MARNKYPEETVKLILETARKLFVEKGYDHTSIQDIINNLGGLSKGAIYHHFKSKEEIFQEVSRQMGSENLAFYDQMRDDPSKNGMEKLKEMLRSAYRNPNSEYVAAMTMEILNDPKFIVNSIMEDYEISVPKYVQPIIEQGIRDGSIRTDYPKELAETIITLINIWINPIVAKTRPEQMRPKMEFFRMLLQGIGVDVIDDEMIGHYVEYSKLFTEK